MQQTSYTPLYPLFRSSHLTLRSEGLMGEDEMSTVLGRMAARQAVRGHPLIGASNVTVVRDESPETKARIDNTPNMHRRGVTVVRDENPETRARFDNTPNKHRRSETVVRGEGPYTAVRGESTNG